MHPSSEKQIQNNNYVRSRQGNNAKNHVSYFSINLSEKHNINLKQKISRNNPQKVEMELDHPVPLKTDYDGEDINELKTQFDTKNEKNEINSEQKIKDLIKKNNDKNEINKNQMIISDNINIINNKNGNNTKVNDESNINKEVKTNNVNSDNKNMEKTMTSKEDKKNYSIKTFDRRNFSSFSNSNYKNIEKTFESGGKSVINENINNGYILTKNNSIIKNQNSKNKNIPRLKVYSSTTCFNTSNINNQGVIRKLVYQESKIQNNEQSLDKKPQKFKIHINKIYTNLNINKNSQQINTEKKQIPNKINEEIISNKENIIINKKLDTNKNPFYTFENSNNTKTTVVVFSKFGKIKPLIKANVVPNCSEKNQKIIGQRSSTNIIMNNSKNSYSESYSFRGEKNIPNKRNKIGINKNQNNKLLFLDKNNIGINYSNYIKSSMTENNKNSNDENFNRKNIFSINNPKNKKHKIIIPTYNYNYDYNYYYGNNTYAYEKNSMLIDYNSPYINNYNY